MSIGAVERDTGLSKDTLRIWERRYGFPAPLRDQHGERVYPPDQVDRLRLVKRLMDRGFRPSKVMAKSPEELARLDLEPDGGAAPAGLEGLLGLIQSHRTHELRQELHQLLIEQGLQRFVLETVAPLNRVVGDAWMRGEIAVFEEHVYSEQMQGVLRHAIGTVQRRALPPRVLLTTLPSEQHGLGLLMVEALLTLESVYCVPLGTETPATDIVAAALAHEVDVVALSFSAAFPARLALANSRLLRAMLPPRVGLWAGGDGIARARAPGAGIEVIRNHDQLIAALAAWRAIAAAGARSSAAG